MSFQLPSDFFGAATKKLGIQKLAESSRIVFCIQKIINKTAPTQNWKATKVTDQKVYIETPPDAATELYLQQTKLLQLFREDPVTRGIKSIAIQKTHKERQIL